MYKTKVTSKGQITIPKEVREKIGIKPGNQIVIKETEAGYIIEKHIDEGRLEKYIGLLDKEKTSDEIIKELRDE